MSKARELDLALMMSDLCGYTALTETHGALQASETVLRFVNMVRANLEPGVRVVDSIGDSVFCASEDRLALVRTALKLREAIWREPEFPRASTGIHCGRVVERDGRLFGAPINLTARLTARADGQQILCTEPIAGAVASVGNVKCRALGEQHFKNVVRPVQLFELLNADELHSSTALDPVCRMQVQVDGSVAKVEHGGVSYWFCSDECRIAFTKSPELYTGCNSVRPIERGRV